MCLHTHMAVRAEEEVHCVFSEMNKCFSHRVYTTMTTHKTVPTHTCAYTFIHTTLTYISIYAHTQHAGCGKTTFLDLLTGRRKVGTILVSVACYILTCETNNILTPCNSQGDLFVNGISIQENRNWYVSNTGYVLQLAAPYYEELTVRENLTLAAWVKLHVSTREKFERVEQVMDVVRRGNKLKGGYELLLILILYPSLLPSLHSSLPITLPPNH